VSISRPTYVTREDVALALDLNESAAAYDRVDRAIESATEDVRGTLRREFSPYLATKRFGWPDAAYRTPWRLWLDDAEVIEVTAFTAGNVTLDTADLFLEPANSGPPYWSIETSLATSASFQAGDTRQRALAVTGLFGFRDDEEPVGELAGTLAADINATASVTWSTPKVGVGSLLRIGSERVLVTDRSMVSTGQTLQSPLAASTSATAVSVVDGAAFGAGQVILLDGERMRVTAVAGNTLVVKRSVDGSAIASHTGSTIYSLTGVTLSRAAQGSTLAAHSSGTTIYRHLVPSLVRDLALAYALNQFLQEGAGYARMVGAGENATEASGRGLRALEADALLRYGRQLLYGAV
jgi:hypothetical protein